MESFSLAALVPLETGERLAFGAAGFIALFGLLVMFAPGPALSFFGLQLRDGRREGLGEVRSAGGFMFGLSAAAVLLAQPMIYLALGAAMALAAFARFLSILSDRGNVAQNTLLLIVQLALAGLLGAYPLGWL